MIKPRKPIFEPEDIRKYIGWMFDQKSTAIIQNSTTERGAIMIEEIIHRANQIDIICHDVQPNYGTKNVIYKLCAAGQRGAKVRILTPNMATAKELKKSVIGWFLNPDDFEIKEFPAADTVQFIRSDTAFRFQSEPTAEHWYASVNQKNLNTKMKDLFNNLWNKDTLVASN